MWKSQKWAADTSGPRAPVLPIYTSPYLEQRRESLWLWEGLPSTFSRGPAELGMRPPICSHAGTILASTWPDGVQSRENVQPHFPSSPGKMERGLLPMSECTNEMQEWIPVDQIAHQVPSQEEPDPNVPTAAHYLSHLAQHPCPCPSLLLSS